MLTGGVWDTYLAVVDLLGRQLERVAMLGNAGGTTARAFARFYPGARDRRRRARPGGERRRRRYFGHGRDPRLHVHDADARPFLRRTDQRYDLIIVDAYRPPYVPFYLATQEFFELVRERLTPGRDRRLNVATTPDDHDLARNIGGTLATELPRAYRLAAAAVQPDRDRPER